MLVVVAGRMNQRQLQVIEPFFVNQVLIRGEDKVAVRDEIHSKRLGERSLATFLRQTVDALRLRGRSPSGLAARRFDYLSSTEWIVDLHATLASR
jgi:hypothetical protein